MLEKADEGMAGGNTKYTAGAMRFAYDGTEDLLPLIRNKKDPRLARTDFGSYTAEKFESDLLGFNGGRPISAEQRRLIDSSLPTLQWPLAYQARGYGPCTLGAVRGFCRH